MQTFDENTFNSDWVSYWSLLTELNLSQFFDEEKLMEDLKRSPGALTEDTGLAYPGALLRHIRLSTLIVERIAKIINGTYEIDFNSLRKVCSLMHLSKIEMFVRNDNAWEIEKRGMNYKFTVIDGCLKAGERSILNAMNSGIKFNAIEFEAMKAMDKDSEDFSSSKYFNNIMTVIIRQANDLAYMIAKEKNKK